MIAGIVGAAAGALGGVLGGLGKNQALRRMRQALEARKVENQNWYDRRYNEDATQRADAQRLLAMTEEQIKARNRQSAGTRAVMGGTEESVAADKEANSKALSDTMSQIAVTGERRKDSIENTYLNRKNSLNEQIDALKAQKKSALDIASDAVGGAAKGFSSFMQLGVGGKSGDKDDNKEKDYSEKEAKELGYVDE